MSPMSRLRLSRPPRSRIAPPTPPQSRVRTAPSTKPSKNPMRRRRTRTAPEVFCGSSRAVEAAMAASAAMEAHRNGAAIITIWRCWRRAATWCGTTNKWYASSSKPRSPRPRPVEGVVSLMSLDFKKAKEDVERIIDNSTGQFKDDFEAQAPEFTKVAESSKVITEANVTATGVESMTDHTAVVLVAVTSHITNSAGAKQDPRTWRLSVGHGPRRWPDQDVESRVRTVTVDHTADVTDVEDEYGRRRIDGPASGRRAVRRGVTAGVTATAPSPCSYAAPAASGRQYCWCCCSSRRRRLRPGCTSSSSARISRPTPPPPRWRSRPHPREPSRCCPTPRRAWIRTSRRPSHI